MFLQCMKKLNLYFVIQVIDFIKKDGIFVCCYKSIGFIRESIGEGVFDVIEEFRSG